MRAPIYLNICFSETKKQKAAIQNMKHTKYLFGFVAVTNFRKWMDCFGFILLKTFAARQVVFVTYIFFVVHSEICFMRKDFPLPTAPTIKVLWRAKNDIQHFLLTVSQTARANGNIIFKLIWIAGPNRQLTKTSLSQIITLQLIDTGKIFFYN